MADIEPERLTSMIGAIYDCAIEPARWPDTLRQVCEALDCVASQLYVINLDTNEHSFATGWGEDPAMTQLLVDRYQGPSSDWQREALAARQPDADPDEPFVLRRLPNADIVTNSEFFRAWAGTLGYCDAIMTVVLEESRRVGMVGLARHESVGFATDREVALMRLLAPHFRRAVNIGNLLDMRTLEAAALRQTMDGLTVGIGVVTGDASILHANAAAQAMLDAPDGPIRDMGRRLAGRRPEATAALREAIAAAASGEATIGKRGISVVLGETARAEEPSVAHVLPLTGGTLRPGLVPSAAAAVFVSPRMSAGPLDGIAAALGLTAAEARLLERLVRGESLPDARKALGIAETTAKTHLAHIFAKAGVSRQADLLALVARMVPPARG
jgi:DNA-binding CsgD family transcriptional regulator/PAS domain-containing protein